MSITTTVSQTVTATKRRTYRTQIETPDEGTPIIYGFRETKSLDAAGNKVGANVPAPAALQMTLTPEAIAALPAEYQPLPGLISSFFDWLEAQQAQPAQPASPVVS
jgi:hypothetical protein